MRLLWRAQLDLPGASLADVKAILSEWLRSAKREPSFPGEFRSGDLSFEAGGRLAVDEVANGGMVLAWAMRYDRPLEEQGLVWTTAIGLKAGGMGLLGQADVYQSSLKGGRPKFDRVSLSPPGFLRTLRDRGFFGPGRFHLQDVGFGDARAFVHQVCDATRRLPLVAVSVDRFNEKPLVDPKKLQDALVGVAQVMQLSKAASLALPREFERAGAPPAGGRYWGVYGGALKIYRAQADVTGSAFDHPIHMPSDVQAPDFLDILKDWLWSLSTLQASAYSLDVEAIRAERRRSSLALLVSKTTREANDLVAYCDAEMKAAKADAAREGERAEGLAAANRRLEEKVQALQYQLQLKKEPTVAPTGGDDYEAEFDGEVALAYYAGDNGRRPALDFVDDLSDEGSRGAALRALLDLPAVLAVPGHKAICKVRGAGGEGARAKLWEYRVNTKDFWLRFFFARATEGSREVLVLSGYKKKQNDLDEGEIERAAGLLRRAWERGWG